MLKTLTDIKLKIGENESSLYKLAEKTLKKKPAYFRILKKSLDARNKRDIRFVYSIEFSDEPKAENVAPLERLPANKIPEKPVLVVGSGPAGLFCAIRLTERGIPTVLIERGDSVEERERKNTRFFKEGTLDTESNIQFGEGGAGTFSDGKLNTGTHDSFNGEVLKTFVKFGAPEEIEWLNKPHIGSDNLKKVVKNMREYLLSLGTKVSFNTKLTDFKCENGKVVSATLVSKGKEEKIDVETIVLAVGHSARDTFETCLLRGVSMRKKDFAVGVRIEHLQSDIGFSQYGEAYGLLPSADYKLVSHASERATFSFCMCPGGFVMPATSEAGGVVTNGMSNYARDGKNANSALIVQVTCADYPSDSPLAGVEFQRQLERNAFKAGGGDYKAPVQLVGDFLEGRESTSFGKVLPTYSRGTSFADLNAVLPPAVSDALKRALPDMDRRLKGFCSHDAVLTGVESRTSSPVRLDRDETYESVSVKGLFPAGEGAGYAGGITSSAADGLRVADAIYKKLCV